jgi:HSP20 family protein
VAIGDLDLSVTGDSVTLEGERQLELPQGASYVAQERQHGRFRRVVALPQPVDAEKVKAEYAEGLLTVTMPKAKEAEPRTVKVKTE